MFRVDYQAVEHNACQYLSCYGQERDSSVVVATLPISLSVEVDDGRIFELLRYYFLIPHTAEKVCQLLYQRVTTTMLVYFGRAGICTWGFSNGELFDCLLAFFLADGLSRSVFVSTCGMRAIVSALIYAGLFRTALTCTAHLFKMAGLSVISVVPSTLRNGDVPDDCGP